MNDEEIKEVCRRLDEAMSRLYKKAKPMGSYDIRDSYDISEKMIDELWIMEIEHMVKSKELHNEIDSLERQLRKSDNEKKWLEERMIYFNKKIREVDRMEKRNGQAERRKQKFEIGIGGIS